MKRLVSVGMMMMASAFGLPASAQSSPSPSPTAAETAVASAADAAAARLIATKHVPGMAIAIAQRGRVLYAQGYGLADVAGNIPVTTNTRFEIGSLTKQMTAAAILQLVETNKISLDDRLARFVSSYFVGRGVTVRALLEQTSGIPEYSKGDDALDAAGRPATFSTILARIEAQPLAFPTGTRWEYSNTNYVLLGRIIEVASGERYEAYVREHVFAPAGMAQSGFIDDEPSIEPMARGYTGTESGFRPAPKLTTDWYSSAGSVVSTVGDILKWDDALLAGKIVSPEHVALMRTSAVLLDGTSTHYGFGWIVDELGGHARVWHNGGTFGFHAVNATFPSDGVAIVMLANSSYPGVDAAATDVFAALQPDVAAAFTSAAPGEDPAITMRAKEWLHRFEVNDIDRGQLDAQMAKLLTPELTAQVQSQFGALGPPQTFVYRGKTSVGSSTVYAYLATFPLAKLVVTMGIDATGKISGYRFSPP